MSFPRYPKYKDSGVEWLGEVPEGWEVKRLKHVCSVRASNVDKKSYDGETPVLLCNYTDVYYNDVITSDLDFMQATASKDQIRRLSLRKGDTIITKDSETADDIAISAYVPTDLPGIVCGYHLSLVRPSDSCSGAYIKRIFDTVYAKSCFAVLANGLTRVGLGQNELDNFQLPLPPLPEQQAIAAFLDRETARIDALVSEQETLITLLKEKRQAVISHAVTQGLDPNVPMKDSGVEWLGKVPGHWEPTPVRLVARLESGHTPSRNHPEYWENCRHPWFTLSDVWQIREAGRTYIEETCETISDLGLQNSAARLLPKGTVMLSRTASIGFAAIMAVEMATTQDFANWVCGPRLIPEFLLRNFHAMKGEFERLKYGSTHNTIYMPDIQQLRIALPPVPEQHAIVAFLDRETSQIDALILEAQRAIELLKERRAALISAAVTGQIDVRGLSSTEVA